MHAQRLAHKAVRMIRSAAAYCLPHPKIFCIGKNKTGTTSLKHALQDLGYVVGSQTAVERLLKSYAIRDFRPLIRYCHSAQAFQDVPFSWPYTYQILDYAFPRSKFILTIRHSAEEWYRSLTRFHAKLLGLDHTPRKADLQRAPYIYPGAMWEVNRLLYNTPEDDPYNEAILTDGYRRYNAEVEAYFKYRDNLLVLNVTEPGSYHRLCAFLGRKPRYDEFPWLNQT